MFTFPAAVLMKDVHYGVKGELCFKASLSTNKIKKLISTKQCFLSFGHKEMDYLHLYWLQIVFGII